MKKIIILLTLVVGITLGACSDFLDARAYDFVSPEEFYKNENDAKMALAGVYSALAMEHVYGNRYSCMISNVDDLSFYGATGCKHLRGRLRKRPQHEQHRYLLRVERDLQGYRKRKHPDRTDRWC